MPRNASDADRTWSTSLWARLGLGAGLWVYVHAALLVWASGWQLWLGLAASTAAVVALAWVVLPLYPEVWLVAGLAYWVVAIFVEPDQHPARALLAWSIVSLVLGLAAGLAVAFGRRPTPASGALPARGWPPSGPRRDPGPQQSPGGPDPGLASSPVPAVPLGPAPALRAGAEADPDED